MHGGRTGGKSVWLLILFVLAGLVVGGLIGELIPKTPYLNWLNYGDSFGLNSPVSLDLGVLTLQFGFAIKFTIIGIMGMAAAIFLYRRL